jgi:adenylate kinase
MKIKQLTFLLFFFICNTVLFALEPIIILVGPPGAGKGSCAQYLKQYYGYNHVSIGDLIRMEIENKTELGLSIEDIVKNGGSVDQQIVRELVRTKVEKFVIDKKPFIIDGFCRNDGDGEFLKEIFHELDMLPRTMVLYLECEDEVCIKRIEHRIVCSCCGNVYNTFTAKPLNQDYCDVCGSQLKIRLNDSLEKIRKRFEKYHKEVKCYYKLNAKLFPTILYNTNKPYEECCLFYDQIAKDIKAWEHDASSFVKDKHP